MATAKQAARWVDEADMIAFTGSVNTGKRIAERAAIRLIPVSLELGGKDPMIVCRDADIERAANAAVWGAFTNSGQVCISVERVYVEETIADEFTKRVVEKTRALRQGIDEACSDKRVDVGRDDVSQTKSKPSKTTLMMPKHTAQPS